ncbi:MAG: hypothetical protein EAZ89_14160 [Bacteroidetes bacterium]|nr:MAG: hypothetical protein EAZ89_14160 [Bacteroidota bacterium]
MNGKHPDEALSLETMIAFLEHRLSPAETEEVEHILKGNPLYIQALESLGQALEEDPSAKERILRYRAIAGEEIEKRSEALPKDSTGLKAGSGSWLAVAATVLLLLLPAGYFLLRPPLADRLAASYLEPFSEESRGNKGPAEESPANWATAFGAYEARQYPAAATAFRDLAAQALSPAEAEQAKLYQGVSELLAGDAAAAERSLTALTAGEEAGEAARWYLAWALLKQNKNAAATAAFENIAAQPGEYAEKAGEIAGRLK